MRMYMYSHGQIQCVHKNANRNTQIAQFLPVQVKSLSGFITVTMFGNMTSQIYHPEPCHYCDLHVPYSSVFLVLDRVFVFPFHFFVTVPNSGLTQAWTLMKTVYLTGSAEPFLGSIAALVLTYTFFSSKCFFSHHFKHFNETAKKLCRCSVYTVLSLHWRYITTYTCLPSSIFK